VSVEFFIAARYLKTKRRGLFTLVTTLIGVAGVTIGVAALLTTLSVMNGFQTDIQKKIVGAQAHIVAYGDLDKGELTRLAERLRLQPETAATAPFALGQAIITYRGRTSGIVVKGLDPAREFSVNDLAKSLQEGSWAPLSAPRGKERPAILLG